MSTSRILIALLLCSFFIYPQSIELPGELLPGKTVTGKLNNGETKIHTFVITSEYLGFLLHLEVSRAGVELIIKKNTEIVYRENLAEKNTTVKMAWWTNPAIEPGIYTLELISQENSPHDCLYSLDYYILDNKPDYIINPDSITTIEIVPEQLGFALCEIYVPDKTNTLRIDVLDADFDADLFLFSPDSQKEYYDFSYKAINPYTRETLIIDKPSSGKYKLLAGDLSARWPYYNKLTLSVKLSSAPPQKVKERKMSYTGNSLPYAVIEIFSGSSSGTGVIIAPQYILTASHVVSDRAVIAVSTDRAKPAIETLRGEVVYRDTIADLALVKITAGFYDQLDLQLVPPPLVLSDTDPSYMTKYTVWGYSSDISITSRAIISCIGASVAGYEHASPLGKDLELIRLDTATPPGFSGAPLLDSDKKIAGIIIQTLEGDEKSITIAVPAWYIKNFLKKAGIKF
ncbi:serine protease [Spirochaetia bacterium 38H-sp]|uniref:Serine protease n=1 Tax=Rarispira pelagica TaxID=3141764 RepID=A0ABU9U9I1_9SPIR